MQREPTLTMTLACGLKGRYRGKPAAQAAFIARISTAFAICSLGVSAMVSGDVLNVLAVPPNKYDSLERFNA